MANTSNHDDVLKFACTLAYQSPYAGIVELLAANISKDVALHALVDMCTRAASRRHFEKHAATFANAILARPADVTRGALLMHLLNVALSSERAVRSSEPNLFVRAALDGAAYSPSIAVCILARYASRDGIIYLLSQSRLFDRFELSLLPCYEVLAKLGAGKVLARRIGEKIINGFVESHVQFLPVTILMLPHISSNLYDDRLVGLAIGSEGTRGVDIQRFYSSALLIHMLQCDERGVMGELVNHPRFDEFVDVALEALEPRASDNCRALAPILLLSLAVRDMLPPAAMLRFEPILQQKPELFAFAPTDDINALRRIVELGEKFHLGDAALRHYKSALVDAENDLRRTERLANIGLGNMSLPDAFHCPVTMEVMKDPVVASDGHSYERSTLLKLLQYHSQSPLTRAPLDSRIIVPNINLRKRIRDFADDACDIADKVVSYHNTGAADILDASSKRCCS